MQIRTQQEAYSDFIQFVLSDLQKERQAANRRMLQVFAWCFAAPIVMSASLLVLVQFGILSAQARGYLGGLILVGPVLYTLYVLSSEVFSEVPSAFRRGGMASTLDEAKREGVWRSRVVDKLSVSMPLDTSEWDWIIQSYEMDMSNLAQKNRHLVALYGAVLLLVLQGLDLLADVDRRITWTRLPGHGWMENSAIDLTPVLGVVIFLMLLYLSSSRTHQYLMRYLHCARLVRRQVKRPERGRADGDRRAG